MKNREAIEILKTETCYECSYGCDSASTCECLTCDYRNASVKAIQALKVVETFYTLVDIHKQTGRSPMRTINMDQLKQVLDEYMGKEGEANEN